MRGTRRDGFRQQTCAAPNAARTGHPHDSDRLNSRIDEAHRARAARRHRPFPPRRNAAEKRFVVASSASAHKTQSALPRRFEKQTVTVDGFVCVVSGRSSRKRDGTRGHRLTAQRSHRSNHRRWPRCRRHDRECGEEPGGIALRCTAMMQKTFTAACRNAPRDPLDAPALQAIRHRRFAPHALYVGDRPPA